MATVKIQQDLKVGNNRYIEAVIANGAAATEVEVEDLPDQITIERLVCWLGTGTGTVLDPAVGRKTGFALGDFDELGADIAGAPAARVGTIEHLQCQLVGGKLFVQPRVDAGSDNAIRVELHIRKGWGIA